MGGRAPWLAFAMVVGGLNTAAAQTPDQLLEQDRIDLTGRTSLTLGSGARAFGMGGAFLARADDATAASWNPAGLSYLRTPEVSLAGTRTLFNKELETDLGIDVDRFAGKTPDFAALTWPVRFRGLSGAVQVSFQRAVQFGGTLTTVRQRANNQEAVESTGEASGGFDVLAFGTGWRITRSLRTGFTVNRWFNGYKQTLDRDVPDSIRRKRVFDADYGFEGWNANFGLIWTPVEQLNLGAVFKTPFTGAVHLNKKRTDYFFEGDEITTNTFFSDDVRLRFPAVFGFGTSWRPRSALTLSADITRTLWSNSEISKYFTLQVTPRPVPEPVPPPPPVFYEPPLQYPALNKPQGNTDQIRFGVEYVFIAGRLKLPLRAGYFNDQQIDRAADGSSPRFNGFTAGLGIIVGPILFDVAYLYETGQFSETVTTEATAVVPSVTTQRSTRLRTERFFVSLIYRIGSH